ncbi:MAG: DUF4132 domain-containing protein [Clostridia bacterium]|nr:DUF4132 domain-containing protein [Clostridia bacterium]
MEFLKDINQIYNLLEFMFKLNETDKPKTLSNEDNEIISNEQILNETTSIELNELTEFPKLNSNFFKENNFISQFLDETNIKSLSDYINNIEIQTADVEKLCKLMFQLNNFVPMLCNLTSMFLSAKQYEFVYKITSKIFVSHIGNKFYHSQNAKNFNERFFDRFIEIIKCADIEPKLYIPFLFRIYKSDKSDAYNVWKNPALEYLQTFWNKNESWFLEFIDENPEDRYHVFSAILNVDSITGVEYLINDYISERKLSQEEISNLIKIFKRDILFFIERETPQADAEKQAKFVEIMLNMDSDAEVMSRIKFIYENSNDANIKKLISNHLGKDELLNKRTEKQFLNAVRREIKEPQERIFGISFNKFNLKFASGYPADNSVYTYLINLFKDEKVLSNLARLSVLNKIFSQSELNNMTKKLFEELSSKPDIKQAKWCCRFVALLSNAELEKEILNFIITLFETQRYKEGIYLIQCLIHSKKTVVISTIKQLLENKNAVMLENIEQLIKLISEKCSLNVEDVKDLLVTENFDTEQLENEKRRLFNAFISEKMYTPEIFNNLFIKNKLYNYLAQNLVFGEYKKSKLYNAFIVDKQEIKFLIGKGIKNGIERFIKKENVSKENDTAELKIVEELTDENIDICANGIQPTSIEKLNEEKNKEIFIGIIHPLDCDEKFNFIFNYFSNPTFNQFEKPRFNIKNYKKYCVNVNNFSGLLISPKSFCRSLTHNGFSINKFDEESEFNSLVHIMPSLNLICEVEFNQLLTEKSSALINLGNICFYKSSDTLKANNKYITKKANSLNINSLPYRYFNYVLSLIQKAISEK